MTGSFDLLVVDINMPKMDGYQVIRTVREDPALWRVPVITISTEEDLAKHTSTRVYDIRDLIIDVARRLRALGHA